MDPAAAALPYATCGGRDRAPRCTARTAPACHAATASARRRRCPRDRLGRVEDIDTIGTDRHRLDSYTDVFAANQYALYPESAYRFTRFRKTRGYANHPLDGIWLRAPYLHNGSVPTLADLLEPAERRPKTFYGARRLRSRALRVVSTVRRTGGRCFSMPGAARKRQCARLRHDAAAGRQVALVEPQEV